MGTTVCAVAEPDRPLWFPGSTPPPWLDGTLPGDFGFDPLGLGKSSMSENDYTKGKHQTRAQIEQQAVPVLE